MGFDENRRHLCRRATLVLLASAMATFAAACGGAEGQPSSAPIVRVGQATIDQAEFERTLRTAEAGYARARGGKARRYYVPPKFRLCIQNRRDGTESIDSLRRECRINYEALKTSVLGSLIEKEWLEQGARRNGIRLSVEAVRKRLDVPNARSEAPAARLQEIGTKLIDLGTRGRDYAPSGLAVTAYYRAHRGYFREPERRDALVIAARSRAAAIQSRRAITAGTRWTGVADRYALSGQVDRLAGWARRGNDPLLGNLVFKAAKGRLIGPVSTGLDWYVLKVTRVLRPSLLSLGRSRESIAHFLAKRNELRARSGYWRQLRLRARARTICLTRLRVPECRNGNLAAFPNGTITATQPLAPQLPHPAEP